MSRYAAPSDMDYFDQPWNRPIRCLNPECDQQVETDGLLCRDCEAADHAAARRARQQRLRDDAFQRAMQKDRGAA